MSGVDPPKGTTATCARCGLPIVFAGPYWDHVGESNSKHIAYPVLYDARAGAAAISPPQAAVVVPVPEGFAHEEALLQLSQLVITLLTNGMPEREIAKRLMRYHPAGEG